MLLVQSTYLRKQPIKLNFHASDFGGWTQARRAVRSLGFTFVPYADP